MNRGDFLRKALLLAALRPVGGAAMLSSLGVDAAERAESVSRRLRLTLRFTNDQQTVLKGQAFWCYLPALVQPSQLPSTPVVSMPHQVLEDPLGHRVLELNFDSVPPLGQKVVTVSVQMALTNRSVVLPATGRGTWLCAERFIESDHPLIIEAAKRLESADERETASAIFEFVRRHVNYESYLARDMGALHALVQRQGDCTEYASLVVALARAAGIPARMVGGYVVERDIELRAQDYHDWAEICLDGHWRIVDAQKGNFLPPSVEYVAFRFHRDRPSGPVGLANRYLVKGDLRVSLGGA